MRKSTIASLVRLAAIAALSGVAGTSVADEESVTFVESVRCSGNVCEASRRTIPVLETVRTADVGDFCVEYTRRVTGFKSYATADPSVRIRVPQYEQGEKRYFRCARGDKVASAGPLGDNPASAQ